MTTEWDPIKDRIRQAEKISMQNRPRPRVRKWRKTRCPKCDHPFQYEPQRDWIGEITCPLCGYKYKIPNLGSFLSSVGEEEMRAEVENEVSEEPSELEEVVPSGEAETETAKKVEAQLEKIQAKIEGISKIMEVPSERMNPKDDCCLAYQYGPGPRTSVGWFYPSRRKPGYRLVLAEMVEGRVGKRTFIITDNGVESKSGEKTTISSLVKMIKEYINNRGWNK